MLTMIRRLWQWRYALLQLTLTHWRVRYKKAYLGFIWAFGNPLAAAFVLAVVFDKFLKYPMPNFPAFLLVTLIPWWFSALSLNHGVSSVWDQADLVRRSAFPREMLPVSTVLANALNFVLGLALCLGFVLLYDIQLTWLVLLIPLVVVAHLMLLVGASLLTSVMYPRFHDVKYLIETGLFLTYYVSPVFYPVTFVSPELRPIFGLNPLSGLLTSYRHLLFYGTLPDLTVVGTSAAVIVVIFAAGVWTFNRREPNLADWL